MSHERTDHVLDLIDSTLGDNSVSADAMRSAPGVDLPDCRHEGCVGEDECLWMPHVQGHHVVIDEGTPHERHYWWPPPVDEHTNHVRIESRAQVHVRLPDGWQEVGYTTEDGIEVDVAGEFSVGPFRVVEHESLPPGSAVLIDDPLPGCGHWRCVGAESCRWRADVAAAYDVPESAVDPQERFGPLPGPLATFHMDADGNVRVGPQGRLLMDAETVHRALERVNAASDWRERAWRRFRGVGGILRDHMQHMPGGRR